MEAGEQRPRVAATLRALNEALGRPAAALWVKESGARQLRHRDFLAPRAALRAAFGAGQVPADVMARVAAVSGPAVVPLGGCQETAAGLSLRARRAEAFARLLARVRLVPATGDEQSRELLRRLRVAWPHGRPELGDAVAALARALARSPYSTTGECGPGAAALPPGALARLDLKSFVQQQHLEGYDPNLGVLLVTEEKLRCLAELQEAVLQCADSCCHVVHVVSCDEEFQQQQMDLLWRILDPGAHTALQKLLVCGPVKVTKPLSPVGAEEYLQLRKRQMHEASVMKYGERAQDEAWTEVIDVLTAAAIRFEMLSTAHRSQIVLDLEDSSISTKGTKSGAFVMYNCARLATLFDTYQRAVERGTYPSLPPPSELNFSCLREEGEWLLLFNYLLPFPEVLQQAAELPLPSKGIRITASTEAVCKFLIQLSMDFSSYYNRVHILGEPFPHLFEQMFARLQLLAAVRDTFHSALATLHLPPLTQI
ncbi:DALR anticodon-binding domain-containing protein 3 [Nothoprocta perdicaria]|uniref:DALR anticodon-binding domain-containing protein 3 n=1 Tax=Nothoprocta perdicaria TaxID=30464 RepID=UPI000E1BF1B9|nr:DALR anticodon-binding domain-containing protein 3 [Nothoprocta perdicaria]